MESRNPSTPRATQCSAPRAASCATDSCDCVAVRSSSSRLTVKLRKPSSASGNSPTTVNTAKIFDRKRMVRVPGQRSAKR